MNIFVGNLAWATTEEELAVPVHEGFVISGVEEPQPHRDAPDFVTEIDIMGGTGH